MITRPGVEQDVSFFVHDLGAGEWDTEVDL